MRHALLGPIGTLSTKIRASSGVIALEEANGAANIEQMIGLVDAIPPDWWAGPDQQ